MSDAPSELDPLDPLVESFLARLRAGERPAIDDYVARHPQLASQILDLFPALIEMEAVRPIPDADKHRAMEPPARLGDYRILRQIGQGGMGVVYEAVQESLGRHVALKVLPPQAAADPAYLERFSREARSAARLHHGNIVPVYEVGKDQGVHYYAMQYIPGQTLDDVLAEVRRLRQIGGPVGGTAHSLLTGRFDDPTKSFDAGAMPAGASSSRLAQSSPQAYYRGVARVALQVAEALAYAHRQGVVHRDVKPANLLLDPDGQAWVTDFGLARAEDAGHLTATGDIVGTLRYMPPERFDGLTDPRGDVYSLGLTLYEMLTLRPAFAEADRSRLLYAIMNESPPAPRAVDPLVPRDLETIVLAAIEKRPADRFAGAAEMADELRRYLSDEPLRIRPASAWEQIRRWRRRNVAVANLSLAVALLGAVSLLSVVVVALVSRERDAARANQRRAEEAEERALKAEREVSVRSHLNRAAALLHRGGVGQRFGTLAELKSAMALAPSPEAIAEMRTLALAALARPDFEVAREWDGLPEGTLGLRFDADLTRFARLSEKGELTIGRLTEDGEEVMARIAPHGKGPYRLEMSPDGRFVFVGHSPPQPFQVGVSVAFTVWDLEGGKPEMILDVRASVHEFGHAFHPARPWLAVGHREGAVSVYDLVGRRLLRSLQLPPKRLPYCLSFPPGKEDGRLAVSVGGEVSVYDVEGWAAPRAMPPTPGIHALAWHPDGRRLAGGCEDQKIRVWDTQTGTEASLPWEGYKHGVFNLAFNHAGDRLVSTSWNGETRLWEVPTGRLLLTAPAEAGLRFRRDDALVGWGRYGGKLRLHRVAAGRELRTFRRPLAPAEEPTNFAWVVDPKGRVLATWGAGRLSFLDFADGQELASFRAPADFQLMYQQWPGSAGFLAVEEFGCWRWPVRRKGNVLAIGPPRWLTLDGTRLAADSADGRVIVTNWRGRGLRILRLDQGGREVALGEQFDVRALAVSPDGRWAVTCSHWSHPSFKPCRVWDAESGRHVVDLPLAPPCSAGFSPDGRWLVVAEGSGRRFLYEAGTWRLRRDLGEAACAFSPDSALLARSDREGVIHLEEAATAREVARLTYPEERWFHALSFSPDGGALLATHDEGKAAYSWDLRLLRRGLKEIGLDWEWPELPPAAPPRPAPVVRLDLGVAGHVVDYPDARQAVALWSVALGHLPLHPEGYYQRGRAYWRLDQFQSAIDDYSRFLALAPGDDGRRAEVLYRRSTNLQRVGDQAAARRDLLELAAMPLVDFPMLAPLAFDLDHFARGLVARPSTGRDADDAAGLAAKAVDAYPGNAEYQGTLGAARYRQGRWREAVAVLEKIQEQDGHPDAAWWYFLAMSHWRLGDAGRARDCLDRARRVPEQNEIQRELAVEAEAVVK